MKYIDKLLKVLKTDRNTFFTYILTLISAYIFIDRLVEMIILFFTGMSVDYWGPIRYTLALACPIFAFLFSFASKFITADKQKLSFFFTYCIVLYTIAISMIVQWLNRLSWVALCSVPNYAEIINNFSNLIKYAFTSVAIYIPLTTFYKLLNWIVRSIKDPIFPNNFQDSILDYGGLDISGTDSSTGPYSFENSLCIDRSTGKPVKILENRRFQPALIIGPSGTGKTTMVMEPMIARDLEKKFFFNEMAKEMGYTALKTGIATLNCPYDNTYLNNNFALSMLTPVEGKEKLYKAYMNKMIYTIKPDGTIVYRNLGVTVVSPDTELTDKVKDISKNFNIPVILIDPTDPNSPGLNPFIIGGPALCGLIISMVARALYNPPSHSAELAYSEDVAQQAIQNLVILLKVVYPKLHDGLMPNLEDLLLCFTDFDMVQEMCEVMENDDELSKEYALQISYFKQNFYKDGPSKETMKRHIHFASSMIDVLLRSASAKNIICNRFNNIDYTDILDNGKVVLLTTKPNEIGGTAEVGFAQFFLFLMMCSVEVTRNSAKYRIPHFLYIDEFDRYATPSFGDIITVYRKFKVGTIFSMQNLAFADMGSPFMQTLLSNSTTKLTFGNCTPNEYAWWEKEFGERREWVVSNNYNKKDEAYSDNLGGVSWAWKDHMRTAKIQGLKFKHVIYKVKDKSGKNKVNFGKVDFLESKYNEPHKVKKYNFSKYLVNSTEKEEKQKFNPKNVNFENIGDIDVDPVVTDNTDASYFFDNEDAISFNLGNPKNKK